MVEFAIGCLVFIVIVAFVAFILRKKMVNYEDKQMEREAIALQDAFLNGNRSVTQKEFLNILMYRQTDDDVGGVYMIHNTGRDLYLVEKSYKMLDAINKQFYGLGNQDVHTDYKHDAKLEITLFPLEKSKFDTLEELEENICEFYGITSENNYVIDWSQKTEKGKLRVTNHLKRD